MKKIIISFSALLVLSAMLSSCGGGGKQTGQLTGVFDRPSWKGINPLGMVYIKSGTLHIGQSDQDIFSSYVQRPKSVSIVGFLMDDTEVSNNEYRQYVHWVRDSIALTLLDYYFLGDDDEEYLDWDSEIDWSDELLDEMYTYNVEGQRVLDTDLMEYEFRRIDWQKAANNRGASVDEISTTELTKVYPDTLVWIRDFAYSYNEPITRNYFWHQAYDDYPVVGLNWKQIQGFNHWRTKIWNSYREGEQHGEGFRLPFEYEWEYAARGGRDLAPFPWGGVYLRNAKGCLLANFKPGRGNYPEDGGFYTVKVDAYFPNDYGLYNMAGNVAEWTQTAYFDNVNTFTHDLNPNISYNARDDEPETFKRKVIRGGSWKDIGYYLQTGTRNWEYQDSTKSYIGFRSVINVLGRTNSDFK